MALPVARHRLVPLLFVFALTMQVAASAPQVLPTNGAPSGPRTGLIVGQVVDANGTPVPDAIVMLNMPKYLPDLPTTPKGRVMADGEGRFFFADLPAGDYYLGASKEGYVGGAYGQRRVSAASQSFALGEGEKRTDAKLMLWKYAVIGGTVVDEAGEPVVGVTVQALVKTIVGGRTRYGASSSYLVPAATTDDRGMFRLSRLTPASYVIVVPSTQTTVPVAVLNGYTQDYSLLVTLLEATLPNGSNNWKADMENTPLGQPRTQQVGDFALISMNKVLIPPPATPDGRMQVYRTTYYPAAMTAGAATAIAIGSGEERTDANVTLRPVPAVRLSGRIVLPDGTPPAPTSLRLVGDSATDVGGEAGFETVNGLSDATGRFVLLGVPAGEYNLKNASTRFGLNAMRGLPSFWTEQRVAVGNRDVDDLTVSLRPALRVEGRVEFRDATGPVPAPTLGPFLRAISFESAFGDQTGVAGQFSGGATFVAAAVPGRYLVRPYEVSPWFVQSVTLDGKDITDKPFDLQTDATSVVVVYTERHSMVSGTVKDARGSSSPTAVAIAFPADPARWSGYGSNPRFMTSTPASRAGTYTLNNLPAGEYFLIAIDGADAEGWTDPKTLEALALRATRLTVTTAEQKTLDLTLKAIR